MGEYKSSYAGSKIDELLSYIDQDRLLSKDGGTITGNLTVGGNAVVDGSMSIGGFNPMLTKLGDEYYGMITPAESDSDFIRTTVSGILPYASASSENGNASALGTLGYPFNQVVTNNLYVDGRKYGENILLWSGASHMNDTQTVQFTDPDTGEKIGASSMPTGIVLVFSGYDSENNVAKDTSWSSHFVPKQLIKAYGENNTTQGQLFIMGINAGLSEIGGKYLYIREYGISGHASNADSGTNGFVFNNANYVLRRVIGV